MHECIDIARSGLTSCMHTKLHGHLINSTLPESEQHALWARLFLSKVWDTHEALTPLTSKGDMSILNPKQSP